MEIKSLLANPKNYGGKRSTSAIKYIIIHYTANDGDKAASNGRYFRDRIVNASAHYFVDDRGRQYQDRNKEAVTGAVATGIRLHSCAEVTESFA